MQHKDDSVLEAKKAKVKLPPMYKVLLLNDDYTPMEFVVLVLQKFFGMTRERATQVMLKVHREGMGICGVYPRDVALTKVQPAIGIGAARQASGMPVPELARYRTPIDGLQKPDDELLLPNRRDSCIAGNTDFRQLHTEILLENPSHRQKPEKRADIRNDSRHCLRLQPAIPTNLSYGRKIRPTRQELGKIQRLNLVQRPRLP